jgi:hypothetical protein
VTPIRTMFSGGGCWYLRYSGPWSWYGVRSTVMSRSSSEKSPASAASIEYCSTNRTQGQCRLLLQCQQGVRFVQAATAVPTSRVATSARHRQKMHSQPLRHQQRGLALAA